MSPDDPQSITEHPSRPEDEVHRGHELESGLLERVREWTDILPWSRLARTLRVAGSPPLVLLTTFAFLFWWIGESIILGHLSWSSSDIDGVPSWRLALAVIWTLIVWAPAALLLTRQGALLTAGRAMMGLGPAISLALNRTISAWIAALVPIACVLAFGIAIIFVGWFARLLFFGLPLLEAFSAVIVVSIAIPCGVLAFGACVAVPLSWAALANEQNPDPLDSLSRGYESLFRRPLHVAAYVLIAFVIMVVVGLLAWGVATAGAATASIMLDLSGCSPNVPDVARAVLQFFPMVVLSTLGWSLIGGIYLLLRYDTGGQEVEDLWQPKPTPSPPLPEIP